MTKQAKRVWRQRKAGIAIIALLVIFLTAASPAVRSWAVEKLPVVGEYFARWANLEKNYQQADERKAFQEVLTSKTVEVNKNIEMANGILTVEQLILTPTQTVVKLSFKNEGNRPAINLLMPHGVKLITSDGSSIERLGGSGGGRLVGNTWEKTYELRYQRLDEIPKSITLKLSGLIYREGETKIVLANQQVAQAPDGLKIYLDNLVVKDRKGQATIRYATEKHNPWPFDTPDWRVLDDQGELHRVTPSNLGSRSVSVAKPAGATNSASEEALQDFKLQLEWTLPAGRKAIALVNPGYWKFQDQLGEVTIEIPRE